MRVLRAFIWWFWKEAAGLIKIITWNLSGRGQSFWKHCFSFFYLQVVGPVKKLRKKKKAVSFSGIVLNRAGSLGPHWAACARIKAVALLWGKAEGEAIGWSKCACREQSEGSEPQRQSLQWSSHETPMFQFHHHELGVQGKKGRET